VPTSSRRIGVLMDAELGTPEGDELDVLTDLVEPHEEKSLQSRHRCGIPRLRWSEVRVTTPGVLDTNLIDCARNGPCPPQPAGRSFQKTLSKPPRPVTVVSDLFASGPRYRGSNPCLPAN